MLKNVGLLIETGLKAFGRVNSALLLTVFYYLILGPVAVVFQIVKVFKVEKKTKSYWIKRTQEQETEETLRRQF